MFFFPRHVKQCGLGDPLSLDDVYVRGCSLLEIPGELLRGCICDGKAREPGGFLRFLYPLHRRYDFCCVRISSTYVVGPDIENFQKWKRKWNNH